MVDKSPAQLQNFYCNEIAWVNYKIVSNVLRRIAAVTRFSISYGRVHTCYLLIMWSNNNCCV